MALCVRYKYDQNGLESLRFMHKSNLDSLMTRSHYSFSVRFLATLSLSCAIDPHYS
jgi:hypothetical protein